VREPATRHTGACEAGRPSARSGSLPQVRDDGGRRHRFALESCDRDTALDATRRALSATTRGHRLEVLRAVRRELLAGTRSDADDVAGLARFVVSAEQRHPGLVLHQLPEAVVEMLVDELWQRLPLAVTDGYPDWEPRPVVDGDWFDSDVVAGVGWSRLDDDPVYAFMMDSQWALGSQPPNVRTRKLKF
jgi:hypothetical protein